MIRTQLYLPEELYAQAKLAAELEGVNISVIVRRCLKKGLQPAAARKSKKASKGPLDSIIGSISTGYSAEAALHHNDIYDETLPWTRKGAKP